jgi:hypothetical protein
VFGTKLLQLMSMHERYCTAARRQHRRKNLQLRMLELTTCCDGSATAFAMKVGTAEKIAIIANERPECCRAAFRKRSLGGSCGGCLREHSFARNERIRLIGACASDALMLDV